MKQILIHFCLLHIFTNVYNNPTRITDSHLKRVISSKCCIHTVVPPDDGPRYARNMYRLMKYTKNKLCIKFIFLYTSYFNICCPPTSAKKVWRCFPTKYFVNFMLPEDTTTSCNLRQTSKLRRWCMITWKNTLLTKISIQFNAVDQQ